ncbi:hypothetical protein [Phaeacidiphilus oryzae]|uniref:hypothetical protein n=1 Tax=Phaeacidiphilus oryzae TaxID=348818 RepID=UPI00056B7853|nr:hypothetical protein [Phaeacidiphilus oryzae]
MNLRRATGTLLLAVCAAAPGIVPAWAATGPPAEPGGLPLSAGISQLPSPCPLLHCMPSTGPAPARTAAARPPYQPSAPTIRTDGPAGSLLPPVAPLSSLSPLPQVSRLPRVPRSPRVRTDGLADGVSRLAAPLAPLDRLGPLGPLSPLTGLLDEAAGATGGAAGTARAVSAPHGVRPAGAAERELPSPGSVLAPARPDAAVAMRDGGRPAGPPRAEAERPAPVPAATSLTDASVLAPIAAGFLLTAIAMYKHRGLPGGH